MSEYVVLHNNGTDIDRSGFLDKSPEQAFEDGILTAEQLANYQEQRAELGRNLGVFTCELVSLGEVFAEDEGDSSDQEDALLEAARGDEGLEWWQK